MEPRQPLLHFEYAITSYCALTAYDVARDAHYILVTSRSFRARGAQILHGDDDEQPESRWSRAAVPRSRQGLQDIRDLLALAYALLWPISCQCMLAKAFLYRLLASKHVMAVMA